MVEVEIETIQSRWTNAYIPFIDHEGLWRIQIWRRRGDGASGEREVDTDGEEGTGDGLEQEETGEELGNTTWHNVKLNTDSIETSARFQRPAFHVNNNVTTTAYISPGISSTLRLGHYYLGERLPGQ